MKVVAINGSPRRNGNTRMALEAIGVELESAGIELEIINIGTKPINGCMACGKCAQNRDERCIFSSDIVNDIIQRFKAADGIIISSPVYFSGIAGNMKSLLDRVFYVGSANGGLYRGKVAAAVTSVRRSGGSHTLDGLNHYITFGEMIVASSSYWGIVHGRAEGDVVFDLEGMQTMRNLGRNIAWLLQMKEKAAIAQHPREDKIFTPMILPPTV